MILLISDLVEMCFAPFKTIIQPTIMTTADIAGEINFSMLTLPSDQLSLDFFLCFFQVSENMLNSLSIF